MIYKKDYVIAITIAAITLVLVTSTSFTHYYPQLATAAKTTKARVIVAAVVQSVLVVAAVAVLQVLPLLQIPIL
jgi:hypothetical protein